MSDAVIVVDIPRGTLIWEDQRLVIGRELYDKVHEFYRQDLDKVRPAANCWGTGRLVDPVAVAAMRAIQDQISTSKEFIEMRRRLHDMALDTINVNYPDCQGCGAPVHGLKCEYCGRARA